MIRLNARIRSIQLKLSAAVTVNELPLCVFYSDESGSDSVGGAQLSNSTGTTLVTICDGPPLGKTRSIDYIGIVNTDTTSKRVYVYYLSDNGQSYSMINPLLDSGDQLEYNSAGGWKTLDSDGNTKTIVSPSANSPQITKVTKTYADFSAAALTNDIEIYSLLPGERIIANTMYASADFKGGAIASYTISLGITGNFTKYAAAFNAFAGVGTFQDTSNFFIESWTANTSVRAQATSTGANLNTANSGSIDFYIETIQVKS